MGHGCEIRDDRVSIDVLAQGERDFFLRRIEIRRVEQFVKWHRDFFTIRDLDADRVLAGNGSEDVDPLRASGAGDVCFQL